MCVCVCVCVCVFADNSGTLPALQDGEPAVQFEEGTEDDDMFSGAKDAEEYQKTQLVKKSIQELLGRRTGPRWSLPHDYIGEPHTFTHITPTHTHTHTHTAARRGSAPVELGSQQRRRILRAAVSHPPHSIHIPHVLYPPIPFTYSVLPFPIPFTYPCTTPLPFHSHILYYPSPIPFTYPFTTPSPIPFTYPCTTPTPFHSHTPVLPPFLFTYPYTTLSPIPFTSSLQKSMPERDGLGDLSEEDEPGIGSQGAWSNGQSL